MRPIDPDRRAAALLSLREWPHQGGPDAGELNHEHSIKAPTFKLEPSAALLDSAIQHIPRRIRHHPDLPTR